MSGVRVCFGHQSVGADILQAVETLGIAHVHAAEEGQGTEAFATPNAIEIRHRRIGRNGDAASKIGDFVAWCESGAASWADIAMFKLCYVDVDRNTDIEPLAGRLTAAIDNLSSRFPNTRFALCTVPLTTNPTPFDRLIVRVRRRARHPGLLDNLQRNRLNVRLRSLTAAEIPLFDIARLESSGRLSFDSGLDPSLARDHGHLNPRGGASIAKALTDFIRVHGNSRNNQARVGGNSATLARQSADV